MGATPKVYVICDNNCKYEGLTKEQILTAIAQAVEKGTITDVDTGFITTVKTINGTGLKFFVGEQHEYEALTDEQKQGLFAIITNDTTREGLLNSIKSLEESVETLEGWYERVTDGRSAVPKATNAGTATKLALNHTGIVAAFSGTHSYNIYLEPNSLYLAVLAERNTAVTLQVGDVRPNYATMIYCSSVGGDAGTALYRLIYDQKKGEIDGTLRLQIAKFSESSGFANYAPTDRVQVYLLKLADIPELAFYTLGDDIANS